MRLGLLINPIAGMGGKVGLKGTDGATILERAVSMGAVPSALRKAERSLEMISADGVDFLTAPGEMGDELLTGMGLEHDMVALDPTGTSKDTIRAARMMVSMVDLLIFCGGDGTARDILDATGGMVPVLGIPAGVKMHSGVFAYSPEAAGRVLNAFIHGRTGISEEEVVDIDEEAFRNGVLNTKLYGYLETPCWEDLMPGSKGPSTGSDEGQREEIGQFIADEMRPGILYLIGPGSTAKACMQYLGIDYSLLGIDAVLDHELLESDLSSAGIEGLLDDQKDVRAILGVIGGQGFILGRGNQQFNPGTIRKIGPHNLMVLCTPAKLSRTGVLRVDSGDASLDEELRGRRRVVVGYGKEKVVKVV